MSIVSPGGRSVRRSSRGRWSEVSSSEDDDRAIPKHAVILSEVAASRKRSSHAVEGPLSSDPRSAQEDGRVPHVSLLLRDMGFPGVLILLNPVIPTGTDHREAMIRE